MIFLTVGTSLPFNRLVRCMDGWAKQHECQPIFAQVGTIKPADYTPEHMEWVQSLRVNEFDVACELTDIIVAHAGMGPIKASLAIGKPIVILPRKASLGEHPTQHQLAIAEKFSKRPSVFVAWDEVELPKAVERAMAFSESPTGQRQSSVRQS